MRKITAEDERDVFSRWLNGESYRPILEEKDIGVASISRIIDKFRRKAPDLDQLRKMHVRLKDNGFTVYDALRACLLLERLDEYGIGVSDLQHYIGLSQRSLSEKGLLNNVMAFAIRLMQLEESHGRYEKVVEDFDRLVKEIGDKKAEIVELDQKIIELREEIEGKNQVNKRLDVERVKISNELEKIKATHEKLQDFGSEKLQKLANFVHDIDALGFSAEKIQKLAILEKQLIIMGFDPDNLEKDALRIDSLNSQTIKLENRVESLSNAMIQLSRTHTSLLAAQQMLQTKTVGITCRNCGQITNLPLPTKQDYNKLSATGWFVSIDCLHCGNHQNFGIHDIVAHVAWPLLP